MPQPRPGAAIPACLLAWLLPGAGHLYLRRTTKGLMLLGTIGALFVLGLAWDASLMRFQGMGGLLEDPLAILRGLAQMANGAPYLLARLLDLNGDPRLVTSVMHEYGNTCTEVGGLLNILVVLDAYDTALGRKP